MLCYGGHSDGIRSRAEKTVDINLSGLIVAKCDAEGKPMLIVKCSMGCLLLFRMVLAIKDPAQFPVGEVGVVVAQVGQRDPFLTNDIPGNLS